MRWKRHAFTIVELLVVISIIALLVAILLPAVNMAREAARNTQCKSKIKQLAMAANTYESRMNSYPGFRSNLKLDKVGAEKSSQTTVPVSWLVKIAPDLEENALYESWRAGDFIAPHLPILACPSDPSLQPELGDPPTSYMANAGRLGGRNASMDPELSRPEVAVFTDQAPEGSARGTAILYKSSPETIVDGAGRTIMFGENMQLTDGVVRTSWVRVVDKIANVIVWNCEANDQMALGIGRNVVPGEPFNRYTPNNARPASYHPGGGANVAFCDAHVTYLNSDITYGVYMQLMAPNDKGIQKFDNACFQKIGSMPVLSSSIYEAQ